MKIDRDPNRPVRHLEWRVRLLGVGAVLALAGMYLESAWILNGAIAILLVSFALRFAPSRGASHSVDEGAADPDDVGDARSG